ncbi:MAG: alpha/beta hydrolase [Paracoccaceae bacterium]
MTSRKLVTSLAIVGAFLVALALITDALASRREAVAEAAAPPLGQFVTANGARVHALVRGAGPDLILIHGASGNLRDFLPLIDLLAPNYRVIAFDRPGLGWSDPIPDGATLKAQALQLSAAATLLGVKNPIVLGQSYGGSVALEWALFAPVKPAALVLVSSPSLPWPGKLDWWYQLTASWFGQAIVIPLAAAFVPDSYVNRTITDIFAPDAAPDDYLDYIGAGLTLRRQTLRINAEQVNGLRPQIVAMAPLYPQLTMPVELIHGDADTIVPLKIHSLPLSKILPNATLTIVPGAGHMPHHSRPDLVIAAINRAAHRAGLR